MTFYEFGTELEITAGEWMLDGQKNYEKFVVEQYRTDEYLLMCRWVGVEVNEDGRKQIKKWQAIVWRAEDTEEPGEEEVEGSWFFDTKEEAVDKYWSIRELIHHVRLFGEDLVRRSLYGEFARLLHQHLDDINSRVHESPFDPDTLKDWFDELTAQAAETAAKLTGPKQPGSCLTPKGWDEAFH